MVPSRTAPYGATQWTGPDDQVEKSAWPQTGFLQVTSTQFFSLEERKAKISVLGFGELEFILVS
jgi:hypothetical protein